MNFKFVWTYGNIQALRMAENGEREREREREREEFFYS
jgi:hypothetical protein